MIKSFLRMCIELKLLFVTMYDLDFICICISIYSVYVGCIEI